MDGISVYSEDTRTTWVPNEFIDYYMPRANGAFVKVYLYLLRCLTSSEAGFGISSIADALSETESDILRALRYWERESVLTLIMKNDTEVESIKLHRLKRHAKSEGPSFVSMESAPQTDVKLVLSAQKDSVLSSLVAPSKEEPVKAPSASPAVPQYTADELDAFTDDDKFAWLLAAVSQYLERVLDRADLNLLLFMHEELHFSDELILHLFEYCVERGKKAARYIQKVAIDWFEAGIDTVEKAEASTFRYDSCFTAVNRAFALNRPLGTAERKYLSVWNSYGFPTEVLEEACNRTILSLSRPDFRYADKILKTWHTKGVKSLADVKLLDPPTGTAATGTDTRATGKPNRFNAFPQRNYSESELNDLETMLLRSNPTSAG